MASRVAPGLVHRRRRAVWERLWSPGALPEGPVAIVHELEEAVATGWFPAGARVLDVGCGQGEFAAWLAGQGYRVTGIDFAPAAIGRARRLHGDGGGRLEFAVRDVTEPASVPEPFDAVFDKGCYHTLTVRHAPRYVRQLAALCAEGAPFLLLHRWPGDGREAALRAAFAPEFAVESIRQTSWPSRFRAGDEPVRGLAVRMRRRRHGTGTAP